MLLVLHQRWIIIDMLSLGQAALVLIAGGRRRDGAGARCRDCSPAPRPALPIAALTVLMSLVPLHSIFIALSPDLFDMLTLELGLARRRRRC